MNRAADVIRDHAKMRINEIYKSIVYVIQTFPEMFASVSFLILERGDWSLINVWLLIHIIVRLIYGLLTLPVVEFSTQQCLSKPQLCFGLKRLSELFLYAWHIFGWYIFIMTKLASNRQWYFSTSYIFYLLLSDVFVYFMRPVWVWRIVKCFSWNTTLQFAKQAHENKLVPVVSDNVWNLTLINTFMTSAILQWLQGTKQCGICSENLELQQQFVLLRCRHYFHNNCLSVWRRIQHQCPQCRPVVYIQHEIVQHSLPPQQAQQQQQSLVSFQTMQDTLCIELSENTEFVNFESSEAMYK